MALLTSSTSSRLVRSIIVRIRIRVRIITEDDATIIRWRRVIVVVAVDEDGEDDCPIGLRFIQFHKTLGRIESQLTCHQTKGIRHLTCLNLCLTISLWMFECDAQSDSMRQTRIYFKDRDQIEVEDISKLAMHHPRMRRS